MGRAIQAEHLKALHPFEQQLKAAQRLGNVQDAEEAMKAIQKLLAPYGNHHRLLECKLWYNETLLDANHVSIAESGFHSIRNKTNKQTRLRIEATFLLAICYLRQKRISEAKVAFRVVLKEFNKERVQETRRLLQQRIIERIEEESVLAELIGMDEGVLDQMHIHSDAVNLMQKSEDEIYELLGRSIPYKAFQLLQDVRQDAILQIPETDRKLLPAPGHASQAQNVGKRTFTVLKRVGWKTLCDPKSPLYKLWSQRLPKVYNDGYFAAAVITSFQSWKIGLPLLAAGVTAIAMRYGAEEFCVWTRPDSIMETRRKR